MEDFKPKFLQVFGCFSATILDFVVAMLKVFFCSRVSHVYFFLSDPLFDLLSTGGGVVCCQIPGVQMALLLIGKG